MKTKPLSLDDLSPGMHVTILGIRQRQPDEQPASFGEAIATMVCVNSGHKFEHLKGFPFRVEAVDIPFVALASTQFGGCTHVDIRECELAKISDEYVAALRRKRSWWPWKK